MKFRLQPIFWIITALGLSACSSTGIDELIPDSSVDYKREKQAQRNLVVPPDLASARINDRMRVPDLLDVSPSYSGLSMDQESRNTQPFSPLKSHVLPENSQVEVGRDGDMRWLIVDAPAEAVWDRVIDFWQDQGTLLEEQNPQLGFMRTAWLENRANISRDFITDSLRRVFDGLYETGLRDQYQVRFERLDNRKTELYLTHYGMQEKLVETASSTGENTIWTLRDRDPQLEAVMLRRLMVFLGTTDERARAQLAADSKRKQSLVQMVKGDEGAKLLIPEGFARSWRLIGLALDRAGFVIEDRNRSAGLYYIQYNDPATRATSSGFWSMFKFWGEDEAPKDNRYQILVRNAGNLVETSVLNSQGKPDRTDTSVRIIDLLREQLQ